MFTLSLSLFLSIAWRGSRDEGRGERRMPLIASVAKVNKRREEGGTEGARKSNRYSYSHSVGKQCDACATGERHERQDGWPPAAD